VIAHAASTVRLCFNNRHRDRIAAISDSAGAPAISYLLQCGLSAGIVSRIGI
jgi:hypothetical protein